jgi:hypothetical protein
MTRYFANDRFERLLIFKVEFGLKIMRFEV